MARSTVRGFSGARLRRFRLERGLTGDELADAAEVSYQAVSAWETGRSAPTPHLLARVARVLHVTIADLVAIPPGKLTLSDLRVQAGMTQSEIAAELGVSTSIVGTIEKGRTKYHPDRAACMARLYEVNLGEVEAAWQNSRATRAARIRQISTFSL